MLGSGACSNSSAGQNQQAAPEVHGALERAPCGRAEQPLPIDARPLRRVLHRQGVHVRQHRECIVVNRQRFFEQILLKQIGTLEKELEIRLELLLDEVLDCLGAGALL